MPTAPTTVRPILAGQPGWVQPGSKEHLQLISPSKVAAILGLSRWTSAFQLWCRVKGLVDQEPERDRFMVGHAMELAASYIYKQDHPDWRVSPCEVQFVTPASVYGFPALATLDRRCSRGRDRRVLEFKTTESLEDWGDPYTDQAPADYVIQTIALMGFSGYTEQPAHMLVLGPRISQRHLYEIEFAEDIWDWIITESRNFWLSLDADEPPPLDNSVATYDCLRELHPDIERCVHEVDRDGIKRCAGVEVAADLIHNIRHARKQVEHWKGEVRGHKSQLLNQMGCAQHARIGNIVVADRRNHARSGVALNVNEKQFEE